jgi:hypothetical protein
MLARVGVTTAALLLALVAFLGGGPADAGPLNPFGLLFLFLAVLAWFAWDAVIGGYTSAGFGPDGAELPLLARFAPVFIKGVTKGMADLGRRARGADRTRNVRNRGIGGASASAVFGRDAGRGPPQGLSPAKARHRRR